MSSGRALDQRVERGVNTGAAQPATEPRMPRITNALLCLFKRTGSGAFAVKLRCPTIPVSTGAIIELGIAEPVGFALSCIGESGNKRQSLVVQRINRPRFL